nr:restriction endonuclease subunit S [Myxococcus sp. RHSTA-1-4]
MQQSATTQAVTRGLNPEVPAKDSGVEWIGVIPRHWTTMKVRHLCSLTTGGRDTQDAEDGGVYPFFVRSDNVERINSYSFEGEGVLTSGDGAGVGRIFHHYIGRLEFHQRVYLYYGFKGVLGRFFFYYLREQLAKVVLAGNAKSTVDSLRRPMLLDFPITVPPVEEQREIVRWLDGFVFSVSQLRNRLLRQLELLRECREAVITAAVTGQLDIQAAEAA